MRNGNVKKAEVIKEEPQSGSNSNDLSYTVNKLYFSYRTSYEILYIF